MQNRGMTLKEIAIFHFDGRRYQWHVPCNCWLQSWHMAFNFNVKGAVSRGFCSFRSILRVICFCKATTKIWNEFYHRGLTIISFLKIFGTTSIKTRKKWPIFSSFSPFPSMPSVATGDRKQFKYLQIVFNNKTGSLVLEFKLMGRHPLAFYKVAK